MVANPFNNNKPTHHRPGLAPTCLTGAERTWVEELVRQVTLPDGSLRQLYQVVPLHNEERPGQVAVILQPMIDFDTASVTLQHLAENTPRLMVGLLRSLTQTERALTALTVTLTQTEQEFEQFQQALDGFELALGKLMGHYSEVL